MSEKRFELAYEQGNWWAVRDGNITLWKEEVVDLLNNQQDEIQQLKEKLQISEASLALLIDMLLLGDVDELVKRARECARQFAEQFDKFTKEELEEMITGGVSDE